jgi:hypothetical protein
MGRTMATQRSRVFHRAAVCGGYHSAATLCILENLDEEKEAYCRYLIIHAGLSGASLLHTATHRGFEEIFHSSLFHNKTSDKHYFELSAL